VPAGLCSDVGYSDDDHLIIGRLVAVNDQVLRPPYRANAVAIIRQGVHLRHRGDAADGCSRRAFKPASRLRAASLIPRHGFLQIRLGPP
jgi:hypothetical protein